MTHPSPSEPLAICQLTDHRILAVEGEDAGQFLQGQLTCDVISLNPGSVGLAAICNAKGRTVSVFRLLSTTRGYEAIVPADMLEIIRRRLQPYILRARVRLSDTNDRITALLGQLDTDDLRDLGVDQRPAPGQSTTTRTGHLLGLERTDKFLLIAGAEESEAVTAELAGHGAQIANAERWLWTEIADAIPIVTPRTTEEFLPQMLNLDRLSAVSFQKGCYTGQEIVARTHYLGTVKRRMARLQAAAAEAIDPGDPLIGREDGVPVGQVLVAARTAENPADWNLLAVLNRDVDPREPIRVHSSEGPSCQRLPLPYSLDETG